PKPGLRSLADVRRGIRDGHARKLWEALVAKAERERDEPPIAPVAWVDGTRVEINRSFDFVSVPANRILDAAMVALIREARALAQARRRQIVVRLDTGRWATWADERHVAAGLNADLRHGQLMLSVGLAYDWLYTLLSPDERNRIIEGIDRCAIGPFKAGVAAK